MKIKMVNIEMKQLERLVFCPCCRNYFFPGVGSIPTILGRLTCDTCGTKPPCRLITVGNSYEHKGNVEAEQWQENGVRALEDAASDEI